MHMLPDALHYKLRCCVSVGMPLNTSTQINPSDILSVPRISQFSIPHQGVACRPGPWRRIDAGDRQGPSGGSAPPSPHTPAAASP